jgi:hypothetical protein
MDRRSTARQTAQGILASKAPAPSLAFMRLVPMRLVRIPEAFDHPDWTFDVKHDGFRALAFVRGHRCVLQSRNGNTFTRWPMLCEEIAHAVRATASRRSRSKTNKYGHSVRYRRLRKSLRPSDSIQTVSPSITASLDVDHQQRGVGRLLLKTAGVMLLERGSHVWLLRRETIAQRHTLSHKRRLRASNGRQYKKSVSTDQQSYKAISRAIMDEDFELHPLSVELLTSVFVDPELSLPSHPQGFVRLP